MRHFASGTAALPGPGGSIGVTRRTGSIRLVDAGITLGIAAIVLAQFIEITLFTVGGFVVSVQKLSSLILLPASILLMGRIRVPWALVLLGLSMFVAQSSAFLFGGARPLSLQAAATASLLTGLLGAVVLYTALTLVPDALARLGRCWMYTAALVAPITCAQMFGLFPLLNVPDDLLHLREAGLDLLRGVGFKKDPNFQALVLVMGLAFTQFCARSRRSKWVLTGVILGGVLATLSRMGLLASVAVLVTVPLAASVVRDRGLGRSAARGLIAAGSAILLLAALYTSGPSALREYVNQRATEIASASIAGSPAELVGKQGLGSTSERLLLAYGGVQIVRSNLPWGIGAGRTPDVMLATVGVERVTHNTVLELLVMGGVLGLLPIALYGFTVLGGVRTDGDPRERALVLTLAVVFTAMAMLLTITTSIYWVPFVVAVAVRHRAAMHTNAGLTSS